MKSVHLLTIVTLAFSALPVQANVAEIPDPRWEEVPGLEGMNSELATYFNANGITQNEEFIIYDLVSPDGSYSRLETNCITGEYRHLRQGFFETRTQVNFVITNSDWLSDQKGIGLFICDYIETL